MGNLVKKLGYTIVVLWNLFVVIAAVSQSTEFYSYFDEHSTILRHGDSEFDFIKLDTPVHFYSEKYDHIYINTNGILTFVSEFSAFLNQPFPLEFPSIAPFYSNIDTTGGNESSMILFYKTQNPEKLSKASELVRSSFSDMDDFEAIILYVATWENVGYYKEKNDKLNTFQAAIICNQDETYVQFIYPNDGLNWLQAETGELGLPDIRAQAGFSSEDGRKYALPGSGTANVKYLNTLSNIDIPGVWLFRVGLLGFDDNIGEPNSTEISVSEQEPQNCADGYHKCNAFAQCVDTSRGFCCKCLDGYYGNGDACIKSTVPIRVSGSICGSINGQELSANIKLQSYVVLADGRTYTAITPINAEFGRQLQLVLPIAGVIGWLFAKPFGHAKNGYQLTGGHFNHISTLTFMNSGEMFFVNQTFDGLNYWDQLSVKIDVSGNLPHIPAGSKLQITDFLEEYRFLTESEIQSVGTRQVKVSENQIIEYTLDQTITFTTCQLDNESDVENEAPVIQKVSKIVMDYYDNEQAIRIGMLNKIGVDLEANPCTDGTANCGDNTICVPRGDEYDCICKNGFTLYPTDSPVDICVDVDECQGQNACDEHAFCHNEAGGYSCTCYDGYVGNGHICNPIGGEQLPTTPTSPPEYNTLPPTIQQNVHESACQRCAKEAICFNNECICRDGWGGSGFECYPICRPGELWVNGRCYKNEADEELHENEVMTDCNAEGYCTCPENYVFDEETNTCRFADEVIRPMSCEEDFNCHPNATCEWFEEEGDYRCVCPRGYQGDGRECTKIELSCTTKEDLCDVHASCVYNEAIGKSECRCDHGYEGDGFNCQLAPECTTDQHCSINAKCDNGVCLCLSGFERDISDFCVPAGSCGGTYCADNAMCRTEQTTKVSYCECLEGYEGDGVKSCKSVPPPCNIRNTCGLYASCIPGRNPAVYECVCNSGYYGDGYVCVEERNCANTPSLCDRNGKCVQTALGLQCICNSGYLGNGTYCKEVSQHESGFLLISQGVVILRIPFDGKLGRPISVSQMAIGLDKDCAEGRIYWGDISAKKIMSSKYDGTDSKVFISEDIISPEGIAIDWMSRRLYWTDSTKDTIEVAALDNPQQRTVIINKYLVNPRGIAVDPIQSKLFWSDWNRDDPKIEMSELDGTGREILLSKPSVKLPNSLVVLRHTSDLCFADAGTQKIECIDTRTKNIRTIASNLSYPFGLTSTETHFFWTDWNTKQIESVDIYGTRKQGMRTPVFGSHKMYGMSAITDECPVSYSTCQIDNGGCPTDRLCLVNQRAPSGKSCKCLSHSNTCINDVNLDF